MMMMMIVYSTFRIDCTYIQGGGVVCGVYIEWVCVESSCCVHGGLLAPVLIHPPPEGDVGVLGWPSGPCVGCRLPSS